MNLSSGDEEISRIPPASAANLNRRGQRLVFLGKEEVHLEPFDPGLPGRNEVLVHTHLSLMSTGTENIVFNRLFDSGTHWDRWVKYPFYPGYSSVGIIGAIGEEVSHFRPGQRIAFRASHRSLAIMKASECYAVPDALPFEQAVWFALAKIAFHGAQAANFRMGDSVLIIGAGPIGQMSVRWACAQGCARIIVVEPGSFRLSLAEMGGATGLIGSSVTDARDAVLAAGGGRLPRVVIDSTGHAGVFSTALQLAADRGRVVILGDTGTPAGQALTPDVITRGLTIVGAHDAHNTEEWNSSTISQLYFSLVESGRFSMQQLTSHVFAPEDAAEAYATANRDRASTLGLIFDWTGELKRS